MKKVICMTASAAISYGTVFAAMPLQTMKEKTGTSKMKKKVKNGKAKGKTKVKKDTTKT